MPSENIEDQSGAVNHFHFDHILQCAALRGRELRIGDHRIGFYRSHNIGKLLRFTRTQECCGIGESTLLNDAIEYLRTGRLRESRKFTERIFCLFERPFRP